MHGDEEEVNANENEKWGQPRIYLSDQLAKPWNEYMSHDLLLPLQWLVI